MSLPVPFKSYVVSIGPFAFTPEMTVWWLACVKRQAEQEDDLARDLWGAQLVDAQGRVLR